MMPQLLIEPTTCVACGVCVDSCPTDVIRQRENGKAYAAFPGDCQACFLCVIDCPVDAISIVQERVDRALLGPRRLVPA